MIDRNDLEPPVDLDWQTWINRWDRMQKRYLSKRAERFQMIVGVLRETQSSVARVLDQGDPWITRPNEQG